MNFNNPFVHSLQQVGKQLYNQISKRLHQPNTNTKIDRQPYENFANELLDLTKAEVESIKLTVLILGPSLKAATKGSKLRQEIIRRFVQAETMIQPEYHELESASEELSYTRNLTIWECRIAKKCDLVIIIPDSPGSFAELGLFSVEKEIRSKVLVLLNKQYENHKESYIYRGPKKSVEKHSICGGVRYVDYNKYDTIWEIVKDAIGKIKEERIAPEIGVK